MGQLEVKKETMSAKSPCVSTFTKLAIASVLGLVVYNFARDLCNGLIIKMWKEGDSSFHWVLVTFAVPILAILLLWLLPERRLKALVANSPFDLPDKECMDSSRSSSTGFSMSPVDTKME